MNKKLVSLVTTIVLLTSASGTIVTAEPLSDKYKQQQIQQQQHRNDYDRAQKKVQELENAIEKLDSQIEDKIQQIGNNKNKIANVKNNISSAEKDIKKAENEIKEEQELYNNRIRAMYMNGTGGYIDVILGAKDLSDLFSRIETVKRITKLDKKIVNELREKQDNIKSKKQQLTKEQNQLTSLVTKQQQEMDKLNKDKADQSKLIAEAERQSKLYASVLQKDAGLISETKKMIEQMKTSTASNSSSLKTRLSRGSSSYINNSSSAYNNSSSEKTVPSSAATGNAVVSYAYGFQGCKYVWEATGPDTFDCSGFTQYVFAHFGIRIPRVSRDQAGAGSYVDRGNLQPGDLVFFGKGRIHHVGIYVGNDCYIHAPKTGDVVKISSLSGRSDYATARRVLR
ncbi:NlpC/P60 family protein [Clostridium sp. MB40-C1]|uniref:C40 family peptidase n=1 Tax=Clostridium sp. MB40-C1 TaxID=3070996 RepID=UPI0027E10A29|nr:C40 family peptidase [Clostridium sp. MB40-C1]WMJ79979.1 NlpC/P60 family protein [Clostridium sp. MB40-C1]